MSPVWFISHLRFDMFLVCSGIGALYLALNGKRGAGEVFTAVAITAFGFAAVVTAVLLALRA